MVAALGTGWPAQDSSTRLILLTSKNGMQLRNVVQLRSRKRPRRGRVSVRSIPPWGSSSACIHLQAHRRCDASSQVTVQRIATFFGTPGKPAQARVRDPGCAAHTRVRVLAQTVLVVTLQGVVCATLRDFTVCRSVELVLSATFPPPRKHAHVG